MKALLGLLLGALFISGCFPVYYKDCHFDVNARLIDLPNWNAKPTPTPHP